EKPTSLISDFTALLFSDNTQRALVLSGPGGKKVRVYYSDWWPEDLTYPCLYVGKSTNLKKRFSLHLKRGSVGRLHDPHPEFEKASPVTTSCQVRWGIEHIFPNAERPLQILCEKVGFSFETSDGADAVSNRFYKEGYLIGRWRPWFNLDSER
ncbi:MAG: GIY-YIG nuclease family protein, partial [Candidatus Paceibacterota bacterium]